MICVILYKPLCSYFTDTQYSIPTQQPCEGAYQANVLEHKEQLVTLHEVQTFEPLYGDIYDLKLSVVPSYSFEEWQNMGVNHKCTHVDDATLLYSRDFEVERWLIEFKNYEECSKFIDQNDAELIQTNYTLNETTLAGLVFTR